jgi:hypothetical protein
VQPAETKKAEMLFKGMCLQIDDCNQEPQCAEAIGRMILSGAQRDPEVY